MMTLCVLASHTADVTMLGLCNNDGDSDVSASSACLFLLQGNIKTTTDRFHAMSNGQSSSNEQISSN